MLFYKFRRFFVIVRKPLTLTRIRNSGSRPVSGLNFKSGPASGFKIRLFSRSKNPGQKFPGRVTRPVAEPWFNQLYTKISKHLIGKDISRVVRNFEN